MSKPSLVVAALVLVVALAIATTVRAEGPNPGETLDQTTWQKAEGLLPAEILRHYRDGDYRNPVADWPESKYNWPPDFVAATRANEGKLIVGPRGEILSKENGKQPPYVLGLPFPTIDPSDPTAGVKVVWNQFYRFWYFGNLLAESQVNWISPKALDGKVDWMQGSNMAYQCAENLKLNRATVAGIKSNPTAHFYGRIKFNPATFDVDALVRTGK